MDVSVDRAITNLWDRKTPDEFLDVTLTLLKIIQNVLINPDKPKFKKIKRNTAFFFTSPGVDDVLEGCGFEVRDNWMVFLDTEEAFVKIDSGKKHLLCSRKRVDALKAYEVPENSLRYSNIMLGKGKFASVFQGNWESCPVAIKALHPYCSEQAISDFKREAEILRSLKHNNIIILYAVCLQNVNKRHAHVLELMDRTILDVLRTDPDITTEKLVAKALEVAAGLDHIHSRNILHCDIAARNILLNVQDVVKISDFGLARYADSPDCNLVGKATVFPIRWTAPEVFTENVLTKASDVWSYGILCYEFITRGKTPYGTFQNRQIKKIVSTGYRLPKSDECPDDLYSLMLKCWNAEPSKRPSFQAIYQDLINMKLSFAQKQKFAVSFDTPNETSADRSPPMGNFRRQSMVGMRASIRKLVRSVSGKKTPQNWNSEPTEECLTIYTTLLQLTKEKITVHCKRDARTGEVIKKIMLKIGQPEADSYKYALVEMFDPRFSMRRSQPNINTSMESLTPYCSLCGLMDQPAIARGTWPTKEQTRFLVCPRGNILRVLELMRAVREGPHVGQQLSFQTTGYLLQSTGVVSGRNSLMWSKVWAALDGCSLALFDDEDSEDCWDCSSVSTVLCASVSEMRDDMFTVMDSANIKHSFQADDRDDAFRWIEAINAAALAKAPTSSKIKNSPSLHSSKVLVMTGSDKDSSMVRYGQKQVSLKRDEVVFQHNGERITGKISDIAEILVVPGDSGLQGGGGLTGLKLLFSDGSYYRVHPGTNEDFLAWTTAVHKAAVLGDKLQAIERSSVNELRTEEAANGSCRHGSPDSGIVSGDSLRAQGTTPSPDIEDSFSELNRSIDHHTVLHRGNSQGRTTSSPARSDPSSSPSRLDLSPREVGEAPPPLPPRNKPRSPPESETGSNLDITGSRRSVASDRSLASGSRLDIAERGSASGSRIDIAERGSASGSRIDIAERGSASGSRIDIAERSAASGSNVNIADRSSASGSHVNIAMRGSESGSNVNISARSSVSGSNVHTSTTKRDGIKLSRSDVAIDSVSSTRVGVESCSTEETPVAGTIEHTSQLERVEAIQTP